MATLVRGARPLLAARGGLCALSRRRCSSGAAAARAEYVALQEELARIRERMHNLEVEHPAVRAEHAARDDFTPPKLHHINIVSREVDELLHFYRDVMRMDELPVEMFPRTPASDGSGGTDVPIRFTYDGAMQMHLAQQDLGGAFRSKQMINPIERGHIAYRTNDIHAFMRHLDACGVHYSDYGTTFAKEWHQIFFLDPEGTVVEVHAVVA